MSRARHKMRADGGRLSSEPKWNAGGEQNAAKEAEEKKKGGRVHHHAEGEEGKKRADKRARGGHVKHHGKVEHEHHGEVMHKHRKHGGGMNKPETEALSHVEKEGPDEMKRGGHAHKRARGGRIGADKMPLTTAARVKHVTKGETPEEGIESD